MKNYTQRGDTLTLVAPYDVVSGAGMLVGAIFAVASNTAKSGDAVEADALHLAVAPIIGTARTMSAAVNITEALGLVVAVMEDDEE